MAQYASWGGFNGFPVTNPLSQLDVAITSNWDFPEFMTFANGLLPNDRTHQVKAFGFYEFNSEWSLGANLLVQSGRPKVCRGVDLVSEHGENPNLPIGAEWDGPGYGAAYMFCNGAPAPREIIDFH